MGPANQRWQSRAPVGEDDDEDDDVGQPRMRESVARTRESRQSSQARQGVEGEAVAAATASGGDGSARLRKREQEQRRGGPRGRVRGVRACVASP